MKHSRLHKNFKRLLLTLFLSIIALCMILPILMVFSGSFKSNYELQVHLKPILQGTKDFITWKWLPDYPAIKHYIRLLFYSPQFFVLFFNSLKITFSILLGQLLIALPGSWAFATYHFRSKNLLFTLYIVLMLMPFQVTMLSNYLVLDAIGIMDTHKAVILPAVFSTFPVFLMYRGFRSIPHQAMEAVRIDGANEFQIFFRIGIPLGSSGVLSAMVLGFLEYWNMIEQPLIFLKDKTLWPLALYLPEIGLSEAGFAFAAAVIILIPAGFVFVLGQDYLEKGIIASALKE